MGCKLNTLDEIGKTPLRWS